MAGFYGRIKARKYDWEDDSSQMQLLVDYARISASIYKLREEISIEERRKLMNIFKDEILTNYPDCDFFS